MLGNNLILSLIFSVRKMYLLKMYSHMKLEIGVFFEVINVTFSFLLFLISHHVGFFFPPHINYWWK